ncbi:MAG TPA: substrate-binding domain-containing protein [Lichenihabitans sp.]|jgi:ABC-type sugar transport system substrate-binding protein|nr:substrate-binding domain-containing protein [Lichenihabitans sp.]
MRIAVVMLALVFACRTAAADPAWTGGDQLATNPLGCGVATTARNLMPYNGGRPSNPPDRAGQPLRVVNVPKVAGNAYFAETQKGMEDAAHDLGNVTVLTRPPHAPNATAQADIVQQAVSDRVDAVLFAADDPAAVAGALKEALAAGTDVVGYDADAEPEARQWFVDQAEPNGIAKVLIDELARQIGETGRFAIVTSSFAAPNQARWIAEMAAYAGKCHPNLVWLETVEAQEDNVASFDEAQALMSRHGGSLGAILALTSVATPAAAEAVTEAGQCGKVAILGLATPRAMRSYIEKGCVEAAVLWNPVDLGYAAVYVLRAVADGTLKPGDVSVEAGRLGRLAVIDGSDILLGMPFVFTRQNVAGFDF